MTDSVPTAQSNSNFLTDKEVFDFQRWNSQLSVFRNQYIKGDPYPHVILDNFLNTETLQRALNEFPSLESSGWINYVHVNERKYGRNKSEAFPSVLKKIFEVLNSQPFVEFLSCLSGIQGLFADLSLEGGGLHQSGRDGFLNIHADFTVHPHHRNWQRRINVLIYLNKDWKDEYNGHLELWDREMKNCVHKIAPVFNRCVIFNTDADAFHGHPKPLQCPQGTTRKSIALYYFTVSNSPLVQSTEYRARPGDGAKGILIYLDKMFLRFYDQFKRVAKIDDTFASNALQTFDRWKKKLNPKKKD